AAVAILALVGDLYGNGVPAPPVKVPMIMFILGIVSAGFAHAFAYVLQLRLYGESALDVPNKGLLRHGLLLYTALSLAVISIILFGWGAIKASGALSGPQDPRHVQLAECPETQAPAHAEATDVADVPAVD